jgi:hypothetical protein
MPFTGSSIGYYRERAKQIRESARKAKDPETKRQLEVAAKLFEQLADIREQERAR